MIYKNNCWNYKKIVFRIIFFLFCCVLFAESNTWTLGIEEFEGEGDFTTIIPQLVLNSLSKNLQWELSEKEQIAKWQKSIQSEKKSIYSNIQSLQKQKDNLIFTNNSSSSIKSKSKELDTKIAEQKIAIEELNQKGFEKEKEPLLADVVVLENLQPKSANNTKNNNESKIDAIIKGSVSEMYGFLYVKMQVFSILGSEELGNFSLVYSEEDINILVEQLVFNINSIFQKDEYIDFTIVVMPENIADNAIIRIDQTVYKNGVTNLKIPKSNHLISVEASGYNTKSFNYDFSEKQKYKVTVKMEKSEPKTVQVRIPLLDELKENATIYVGSSVSKFMNVDQNNAEANIEIKSFPTFGEIVYFPNDSEETVTTFVSINDSAKASIVNIYKTDINTRIENSRKKMYTAYGIFLLSLPLNFYLNGRLNDVSGVLSSGNVTDKMIQKYNVLNVCSKVSTGIVIGTGINFVIQLVKYMKVADTILPNEVGTQ